MSVSVIVLLHKFIVLTLLFVVLTDEQVALKLFVVNIPKVRTICPVDENVSHNVNVPPDVFIPIFFAKENHADVSVLLHLPS